MSKRQTLIDMLWKDNHGRQAVVAWPNFPLVSWFVFMLASKLVNTGKLHLVFEYLAYGFLFTWGWLEIRSGKSYFRRALGMIVLIFIIYGKIK